MTDEIATTAPVDPLLGRIYAGRYQVNNLVATGGMGRVYRARQRGLDRWVALKVLHNRHSKDDTVVKRFYTEMRATARIEHPHSVRVYDFGHTEEGELFLVMELLRGEALSDRMDAMGAMDATTVARIGAQIARALEAAHAAGVVHRDLKPDNIMLTSQYGTPDMVKVLDFGLARIEDDMPQHVTAVGKRVGTPLYMAPEYIRNRLVDERSDLYALGAVLYELSTGRVPYEGSAREVLRKQVEQPPTPPRRRHADVPDWLDRLIVACMHQDPSKRPASASVVARELELRSRVVRVVAEPSGRPRTAQWQVVAIAAGVASLIVAAVMSVLLVVAAIWVQL